jgi:hypothetical protein
MGHYKDTGLYGYAVEPEFVLWIPMNTVVVLTGLDKSCELACIHAYADSIHSSFWVPLTSLSCFNHKEV